MSKRKPAPIKYRLMQSCTQNQETGCWNWFMSKTAKGYGLLTVRANNERGYKTVYAHRASYEEFVGPITDDLWVLHKCDVPNCINPEHLYLGRVNDNSRDMVERGRSKRCGFGNPEQFNDYSFKGSVHSRSKLTEEQVICIRADYKRNTPGERARMAEEYGVSIGTIKQIIARTTWKHV